MITSRIEPRGLSHDEAALYIGVGVTKFDELVAARRMPKARRIDGRVVWDRFELDRAFAELPHNGEERTPAQKALDEMMRR